MRNIQFWTRCLLVAQPPSLPIVLGTENCRCPFPSFLCRFWLDEDGWLRVMWYYLFAVLMKGYGGFHEWGVPPVIIHFNEIFPCKPSSYWGTPISWKPHNMKEYDTNIQQVAESQSWGSSLDGRFNRRYILRIHLQQSTSWESWGDDLASASCVSRNTLQAFRLLFQISKFSGWKHHGNGSSHGLWTSHFN